MCLSFNFHLLFFYFIRQSRLQEPELEALPVVEPPVEIAPVAETRTELAVQAPIEVEIEVDSKIQNLFVQNVLYRSHYNINSTSVFSLHVGVQICLSILRSDLLIKHHGSLGIDFCV